MKEKILASCLLAVIVLLSGCAEKTPLETITTTATATTSLLRVTPTNSLTSLPSAPLATLTAAPPSPSATPTATRTLALTPTPLPGVQNLNLAITIDPPGGGWATLVQVGDGISMEYPRNESGEADSDSWPSGAVVRLTAGPRVDWVFHSWRRNEPGNPDPITLSTSRTITFTVNANTSLTAYFVCEE